MTNWQRAAADVHFTSKPVVHAVVQKIRPPWVAVNSGMNQVMHGGKQDLVVCFGTAAQVSAH